MSELRSQLWIDSLGMMHEEMMSKSIVPNGDLFELFPGIDELALEPEVGVEMSFWAETKRYESLYITLLKTTPSTVEYKGVLPEPYSLRMSKSTVHALFGEPLESAAPFKMPDPIGLAGGWDSYCLDSSVYPNIKVAFQYSADFSVNTVVFSLIEKDYD